MYTGDLSNVMELLFFVHVDNTLHQEDVSSGLTLPLLLILGYTNGFHVWTIPVSQLRYKSCITLNLSFFYLTDYEGSIHVHAGCKEHHSYSLPFGQAFLAQTSFQLALKTF